MQQVSFFPWKQTSSVLGYGTTSFMSADTTNERLALLECAHDEGITHFDTAAYYGFGESERLLGKFLSGRREKVTVTTKFGIEPSGVVKTRWVNLLARRVLKMVPSLRSMMPRKAPSGSTWGVFDPVKAALSLDRSLKALQTDYIDLFLLHEPGLEAATSEPLIGFLENEVSRGRIRAFGCGGEAKAINAIAEAGTPTGGWLQFEDNAVTRKIERIQASGAKCITFAPFNSALSLTRKWLDQDPSRYKEWSRQLGLDCRNFENLSSLLQATCHSRNAHGIVLFSTSRPERIKLAAKVAGGESFSTGQLAKFLELTTALQNWQPDSH